MSSIVNRAVSVTGPLPRSTTTGAGGGVFRIAVGTTCVSASIPTTTTMSGSVVIPQGDAVVGKFIRLAMSGSDANIGLGWGTTGPSLVYGQVSTVDSRGYLTSSAASGGIVFSGVPEQFMLPQRKGHTNERLWLSVIAQSSGTLSFYVSEGDAQ